MTVDSGIAPPGFEPRSRDIFSKDQNVFLFNTSKIPDDWPLHHGAVVFVRFFKRSSLCFICIFKVFFLNKRIHGGLQGKVTTDLLLIFSKDLSNSLQKSSLVYARKKYFFSLSTGETVVLNPRPLAVFELFIFLCRNMAL